MNRYPSVGVIVATRGGRPLQLRAAVSSALAQDYPGRLRVVVVWDGEPGASPIDLDPDDRLALLPNGRTPGLAGSRNTGVLALDTDLVAFCDDDDEWLPGKLRAQVAALGERPEAAMASCGIVVHFRGRSTDRLIGHDEVTYEELLRSRMVMVHSSTYLLRRDALIDRIGLFDESIPRGQNEDWDIALRAAQTSPIAFVDRALVRVQWGDRSYFAQDWEGKAQGLLWMLDRHPHIASSRFGAARVYGQLAFAYACLGRRREAWVWTRRALRRNWHERRVPIALAVMSGLVSGEAVLHTLHSHGHGI